MKLTHSEKDFISSVFSALNSPNQFCYLLNYVSKEILKSNDSFLEDEIYFYSQEQNQVKYYQRYKIKKKNGRFRQITAPTGKLKHLQSCLNIILQTIYLPHNSTFGFIQNASIIENATQHINKEYIFNIDLKDFFASITAEKVALFLQKPPFELKKQSSFKETLSQLIATIASFKLSKDTPSALPQGSPLSPILSNIVCQSFDDSLLNLAKRFKVTYSRYADDISFSGDINIFSLKGEFYQHLKGIIEEEGFLINTDKVRLQSKKWRQEVTGLVVNEKVNIRKKYVKELRMWLYLWETYGYDKASEIFHRNTTKKTSLYLILNGKLNFLRMIKGDDNNTYLVLQKRLLSLWPTENIKEIQSSLQDFIDSLPKKDIAVYVSQMLQRGSFNQTESFQEFFSKSEALKKYKAELIPYSNGMNKPKSNIAFTKGLPFNFIGEWNQPIFSISNNKISPLNGEELGVKRKPLREKINNVLKEIAEKNPNFYEVLINKGSYFTVFTDQNNKIWIKPISLKLDNAKEKIEEQIFQNEKVTEKTAGDVREKYNITTYHNKELVRIKIYEDKYNEKLVNISFNKKVNGETISYYLNEVNKENLIKILNDPSTVKPKLKKPLEGFSNELDLKDSKVSIIKNSNKDDRLELITNGDYSVSDIDNPITIFQNVGFRLKFKEKQVEDDLMAGITSPSIVQTTEAPKVKSTYTLQEISDYVWNNFKFGKNSGSGWIYTVYELKNDLDFSELNSRFVELKQALEEESDNEVDVEFDFIKDFTNKLTVKEFEKRGDIPSQIAF
jgi:RNA-directed DNA polymerase